QEFGKVTSLEYDADCCAFTREKTGLEIIQGSVLELPFADNSFDLVCAFDIIEHVENDQKAVEEMLRVLKPGGSICVTVPAFMSLWTKHDDINLHFRRYRKEGLESLFNKAKGGIGQCFYFNSFL